jgi:hypothetical protein
MFNSVLVGECNKLKEFVENKYFAIMMSIS